MHELATAVVKGLGTSSNSLSRFVDFENSPSLTTGPSTFAAAGAEQDITVTGVATFTGGVVLGNATHFPAEDFGTAPNVYATQSSDSGADPSLQSSINVDVDPNFDVSEISFSLFNGEASPVSYIVNALSGATVVATQTFPNLPANSDSGFSVVDMKGANITQLIIAPSDATGSWDFLIDSVNLNASVQQAVPIRTTTPSIVGVIFSGSGQNTTITVMGSGFGNAPSQVPFTGDLDYFLLSDGGSANSSSFNAGCSYFGSLSSNDVTLNYQSWSDNKIVINGFGDAYGLNGWTVQGGDSIHLVVWNSADSDGSGPNVFWSGIIPGLNTAPPKPLNAPSISSFPPEPDLWLPQPNLQQTLTNDPSIQQYLQESQSTPALASTNAFLNTPPSSGWKNFFSGAASDTSTIGSAAGFAADIADPTTAATEILLDSTRYALEQTPEYKDNTAAQVFDATDGAVADSISLVKDCGSAAVTSGVDVPDDGGCFFSAVGIVSSDILSPVFGLLADDPPDANYSQVFIPSPVVTEALATPSTFSPALATAMTQTAAALDQTTLDLNAIEVTANRYSSALAALDAPSAGMQYVAFLEYLGAYNLDGQKLATDLDSFASLLAANGIGTQLPTADELSQAQTDLQTQGASIPGLYQYFETLGFTDPQIRTMVQQASASLPPVPTASIDQALESLSTEFQAASVPLQKAATTTTLSPTFNPVTTGHVVTFTAIVSSPTSSPTGTVTFFNNGTQLAAPVTLSGGIAMLSTSSLPAGHDAITAVYSGDTLDSASASSTLNQVVNSPQDLSAALAGSGFGAMVGGQPLKLKEKLTVAAESTVSGTFAATIVLSPDVSDVDSVLTLASTGGKLKLKAGKGKTVNLKLPKSTPIDVPAGMYRVLIRLTDAVGINATLDSDQTLNVVAPVVDVTGAFLKVPQSITPGKKFAATLLIANSPSANIAAMGTLPFNINASPDGMLGDAMLLTSGKKHVAIKPGKSIRIVVTLTINSPAFLVATFDPGNAVFPNDLDSGNNSFVTTNQISVR